MKKKERESGVKRKGVFVESQTEKGRGEDSERPCDGGGRDKRRGAVVSDVVFGFLG